MANYRTETYLEEEANLEQCRRNKMTTPEQFECLFRLMREDKDMANGIQLKGRGLLKYKWQNCATELNKLGPHRDSDGWASVWAHLKFKVRRKLAKNDHNFNSKDERVIEILGWKQIMNQRRSAAAAVRKNHRFKSIEKRFIKLLGWNEVVNRTESLALVDDDVSSQENSVAENYVSAPPSNRIHSTRARGEGYPSIHQQKLTSMRQQNDKDTTMMRLFKAKAGLFSITRSLIVLENETMERTRYMQKTAEVKDKNRCSKLKLIELQTDIASRKLLQMDKTNCFQGTKAATQQKMDNVDNRDEKGKVIEDEVMDFIQNQDINSPVQPTDSDCQSVSEKNFSDDTICIKLEPDIKDGFLQNDDSDDTSYIQFGPSGIFPNDDESDNHNEFVNSQRFVQRPAKTPTSTNEKVRCKKRKFEEISVPALKLQQQLQSDKEESEISLSDPLGD